jgi:predicted short-subunit dehydrogenase-like oxidoreductase (DUF2520 family)
MYILRECTCYSSPKVGIVTLKVNANDPMSDEFSKIVNAFIGLTEVVLSSAYSHTHIYVHTSGFNYCTIFKKTERSEQIC